MIKLKLLRRTLYIIAICIFSLFSVSKSYAAITLPSLFTNGVILQQNSNASVWGWATAGNTITIRPSWNNQTYTAIADTEGNWKTKIETPAGSNTAYTITFSDNMNNDKTISNVLVGEVWICAGQSNMEVTVSGANNPTEEAKDANYSNIRVFKVPFSTSLTPLKDVTASWVSPTSSTVYSFGAIPFFFSRYLYKYLNIPVGILHAAKGSSSQEAWLSEENIQGAEYAEKLLSEARNGNPIEQAQQIPTGLYNAMFKPLVPFTIRGVAWYQGERNYLHPDEYKLLLDNFINSWRADLEQPNLPFLITQLSGYSGYNNEGWISVQETQYKISQKYSNIATVMTYDIGDSLNVHPTNKQDVALRMCIAVKKMIYGENIVAQGPSVKKVTLNGSKVGLSYKDVGTGLALKTGYTKINNFMLAGSNRVFYNATATIQGTDSIELSSSSVSIPKYVRYAYKNYNSFVNLYNSAGLPAVPFRTDPDTTVTLISTQSGDWYSTSTWGGAGIPTKDDNVTISTGHTVTNYATTTTTKDLCKTLIVNGTLLTGNKNKSYNCTINVYGPIVCNGIINLGEALKGAYLTFKNKAGLTGTGTAVFGGINLAVSFTDCLIDLPSVTTSSSLSITESASKFIIGAGTSVTGYALSPSSSAGQFENYGYYEIYGKVTYNNVYLCNSYTGTAKATITVKGSGELKATTTITPVRAGSTITGIGGSGCVLTVESGGKLNFPSGKDPIQFTVSTNANYDPKLVIKYYKGSILNGVTKSDDQISAINEVVSPTEQVYYDFSTKTLVFSNLVSNLKIYNVMGQQIYNYCKFTQNIVVPETSKGIYIVKFTDASGKNETLKIYVR